MAHRSRRMKMALIRISLVRPGTDAHMMQEAEAPYAELMFHVMMIWENINDMIVLDYFRILRFFM